MYRVNRRSPQTRFFPGKSIIPLASLTASFLGLIVLPMGWSWGEDADAGWYPASSLLLSASDDTLTVEVRGVPLGAILDELGRQTAITVRVEDSVAEEEIQTEFRNLPLDEGIRRLLQGQSYILIYADATSAGESRAGSDVREIRVLKRGVPHEPNRNGVANLPGVTGRLQASTLERWKAADAKARIETLGDLADHDQEQLVAALALAIEDDDPGVREFALEVMEDMDQILPITLLAEVALRDPSPELRMVALDLLADGGQEAALTPLELAVQDSDPRVSELAQELLADLEEESGN